MRLVLDTNILISGIIFGGKPREVLQATVLRPDIIGLTSDLMAAELLGVLADKYGYDAGKLARIRNFLSRKFSFVGRLQIKAVIKDDPDDDVVLATAVAGQVDFIVSGDKHLVRLGIHQKIKIITADALLALIE